MNMNSQNLYKIRRGIAYSRPNIMSLPHILAVPYPAQGHVIPMMEVSRRLAEQGFRVTFVNSEINHKRVVDALADEDSLGDRIRLVSIPDGLERWEDRGDISKSAEATDLVMPGKLEELVREMQEKEGERIDCIIADPCVGWALEMARKMGIPRAAFWPASAGLLISTFIIPKLITDGIIDEDGAPTKHQMIQYAPGMPYLSTTHLPWACIGDLATLRIVFKIMVKIGKSVEAADWLICNSSLDIEPAAFAFAPRILPIGPLLASHRLSSSVGHFWPEESNCLKWLDQQPPTSVIYVAFGSYTIFDQTQFEELAHGLELSNRPFLWVIRPDFTEQKGNGAAYLKEFQERVSSRGKLVGWAPQQEVLAHPSVACFLSHCGWNSSMEGASNGVPFLCWPYFADQFLDESYICDMWEVGLRFDRDKCGIVTRGEIEKKLDYLLGNDKLRASALLMKERLAKGIEEGGKSRQNFRDFVEWLKTL